MPDKNLRSRFEPGGFDHFQPRSLRNAVAGGKAVSRVRPARSDTRRKPSFSSPLRSSSIRNRLSIWSGSCRTSTSREAPSSEETDQPGCQASITDAGASSRRRQPTNPATGGPSAKITWPVRSARSLKISLDFKGSCFAGFDCAACLGVEAGSCMLWDPQPASKAPIIRRLVKSFAGLLTNSSVAVAVLVPPVLGIDSLLVWPIPSLGRLGTGPETRIIGV